MFSLSCQRLGSSVSLLSRKRAAMVALQAPQFSPIHHCRLVHATAPSSLGDQDVVPIVWTTHRLSQEQIAKVDAIFHKILWLDMFEANMLTLVINQRLGIVLTPKQEKVFQKTMDARVMALAGMDGASSAKKEKVVEEEEGPKLVDLKLATFDAKAKIKVIKEVRAIAGLGLKEAKELVESAPKVIQKGLAPEAAEELKKKLEECGATIELV